MKYGDASEVSAHTWRRANRGKTGTINTWRRANTGNKQVNLVARKQGKRGTNKQVKYGEKTVLMSPISKYSWRRKQGKTGVNVAD